MKSAKRTFYVLLPLLLAAFVVYSLLWGRLLAFSPWVFGFQHRDTDRARIYFHEGVDVEQFGEIDRWVEAVEEWHDLKFKRRAEVFVCASDAEHKRLGGSKARFRALPLYGRLFVSKRAQEDAKAGEIHLDVYVRHELSHSLVFQNTTLRNTLRLPEWLLEGLAVLSAGQLGVDGYYTKAEVRDKMREGYFLDPGDFSTRPGPKARAISDFPLPNKYWFIYAELACFIDDLIRIQGKDAFNTLLRNYMEGISPETNFQSVYGKSFDACVEDFRKRMVE
ncbi:MAG TPA: hypothetical protein PLO37_02435 [Candidatus Hydrogenedentes bacterium]|nr:hypothetical protein [Candidatus Hydrogenedentota bacterium]HPG65676.1 hypothetical protein [Candidatus Hydrogenedentota bacterium]